MRKAVITVLVLLIVVAGVYAAKYHTVPLDNESYRIIDAAQMRGIIPVQSNVRPYSFSVVRKLLTEIKGSGMITDTESGVVDRVLGDLERLYWNMPVNTTGDVLKNGLYKFGTDSTNAAVGVKVKSMNKLGFDLQKNRIFDSRNTAGAFIMGDLFNIFSYDINLSLHIEKVNTSAYLLTEYPIDSDSNYFSLKGAVGSFTNGGFIIGISTKPELSAVFFEDRLSVRFAVVQREWGPGNYNLALAGSAPPMDAFEINVRPFNWLEYTVMQGSLLKFSLRDLAGSPWPSDTYHNDKYDNNFSIHRLDFTLKNFKLGLYESVVWRKRWELAYYNPLAIYMIVQNSTSDYDNMLMGFDFSITIPGFGKIYGAVAVDEFSELKAIKNFITHPRHIMALQGGLEFPGNIGAFSTFGLQVTYIPPFFGSHYLNPDSQNPWGNTPYYTVYVNKGKNIGYPLNPDSLELKVFSSLDFRNGFSLDITVKDQLRSAQYSIDETYGTTILTSMYYDGGHSSQYVDKDLFHNIWNNILDVDVQVHKTFTGVPLKLTAGIEVIADWKRSYDLTDAKKYDGSFEQYNGGYYNLGTGVTYGSWNLPELRILGRLGLSLNL